jgi:hypothetical protein
MWFAMRQLDNSQPGFRQSYDSQTDILTIMFLMTIPKFGYTDEL